MWARVLLFNAMATMAYAKVISMDICADAWVLENYQREDIGAVTFLSEMYQKDMAKSLPKHHGTTEEILMLKPTLVVTEYPLPEKQKRALQNRGMILKTLPPLNTLEDFYKRFPKASSMPLLSIGKDRVVMMITHNLHSPGLKTFWHEILEKLGFKNATAGLNLTGWNYVSPEQILLAKPSMLVVLGENVILPACLKHIPAKHILSKDYLCPSPEGLKNIMEVLE